MGLTERHWFEDEDGPENYEWALEDAVYNSVLLKSREPQVMTLQEALGAEVNVDQCWLEVKGIKMIYLADAVVCPEHTENADIQRWGASDCQLPLDLYGKYWRMWDKKPTEAQREAVKWE